MHTDTYEKLLRHKKKTKSCVLQSNLIILSEIHHAKKEQASYDFSDQ